MAARAKSTFVVLCAVLVLSTVATTGCTIAGTAIGAATPRYDSADWQRSSIELGTKIRVHTPSVGADAVVPQSDRGTIRRSA